MPQRGSDAGPAPVVCFAHCKCLPTLMCSNIARPPTHWQQPYCPISDHCVAAVPSGLTPSRGPALSSWAASLGLSASCASLQQHQQQQRQQRRRRQQQGRYGTHTSSKTSEVHATWMCNSSPPCLVTAVLKREWPGNRTDTPVELAVTGTLGWGVQSSRWRAHSFAVAGMTSRPCSFGAAAAHSVCRCRRP